MNNKGLELIMAEIKNGPLSGTTFHKRPMFKSPEHPVDGTPECNKWWDKCIPQTEYDDSLGVFKKKSCDV